MKAKGIAGTETQMNEAISALESAHLADPRSNPFGFYSCDSFSGGVGMFHWYPSFTALLSAITHDLPWALLGDEPEDASGTSEALAVAVKGLSKLEDLTQERMIALSGALGSFQDLEWLGKFSDLCSQQEVWAVSMRESYREAVEAEDVEGVSPILEHELDGFVEYLSEYGY